jgi:hypothetical protein
VSAANDYGAPSAAPISSGNFLLKLFSFF